MMKKLLMNTALMMFFAGICLSQTKLQSILDSSFAIRGFHLDLRVQVMKMSALKQFAKKLSENGINTLVMEWEGTYPFEKHTIISNQYAYSRAEIKSFVAYCDSLGIDVIPLQQSFGHVEYILKHYRYKELREDQKDYSQVNPIKEDSCKALFTDLYKDLISTHKSQYIHIGGDETYLLGHSPESKQKAATLGMGRLYGDYIKMLCELVVSLGKRPVMWADIALKYPDALKDLPRQTVFIDWNYGWDLNRFGDHEKLMQSGFEIWGAPAIRSDPDNYFLTDWVKHLNNMTTFIPQARALGYKGIIMTSWSTSGLYSPVWESSANIIDLHAVRRVYPISGFNLLIDAFFNSIATTKPIVADEFVIRYAAKKYGLDKAEAHLFWDALKLAPYEVKQGKVSQPDFSIKQLEDSALYSLEILEKIPVKRNRDEFNHYILMANIRYNYLICMEVECEMNKKTYTVARAGVLLRLLEKLNCAEVDEKFRQMNGQLLNNSELEKENELRNYRYKELVATLKNQLDNNKMSKEAKD